MIREGECKSFLDKMYRYNIDGQVVRTTISVEQKRQSIDQILGAPLTIHRVGLRRRVVGSEIVPYLQV